MNSILKIFIFVTSVFSAPPGLFKNNIGTPAAASSSDSILGPVTIVNQRIQEIEDIYITTSKLSTFN
ncbi:hypothetical protein CONCODRAFT_10097 [Conidiobolus coronatus NRRL 28638]|uniref:Uncharacterized protein n=1 Tax=Conidiobolus coronatus (strain ATCC 28846 / CBS 209.66 / NRRL 28638) TaxID=796925 RepID=A0A137NYH8_CONC2|nr:hypothetical protein CONCODRAFT_10097 [Conidiobolus coronatus NRRL 28638]|eukprot:KXN67772.1 hypothetical protein CONCODRAFT_10097 [Conidiobolus coronatus NRRL 28638]